MRYSKQLQKIEEYVLSYYTRHFDYRFIFHTYPRARDLVATADKISKHHPLDERSAFIVSAATWFHDAGYLGGDMEHPELKSVQVAEKFLKEIGTAEDDITEIRKCILATQIPGHPESLPEKIVCDAETFYVGTSKFKEIRKLIRKELEAIKKIKIDSTEWIAETIRMMESLEYHTDYCRSTLNKTKEENLNRLKNKQAAKSLQENSPVFSESTPAAMEKGQNVVATETASERQKRPTRGIETMFRISSANSQKISAMADNKAHIMISVNSIIISAVLGLIVRKLNENRHLLVPTIILLAVNVATIIYSILATRPKVHQGIFTDDQIKRKSVNLLFYGSFYNMDLKDFDLGMRQMMSDREFLYGSLIKDIYWQGKVLGRKYKLLHTSYNIFMYGIALAVVAYTIAAYLSH